MTIRTNLTLLLFACSVFTATAQTSKEAKIEALLHYTRLESPNRTWRIYDTNC